MVFVNTNMGGMDAAAPDTCKIPAAAGAPVPTPLPNMADGPMTIPSQFKVLVMCLPAHNMASVKPLSSGDEPGVMMGVASGMIKGPSRNLLGSFNFFPGCMPATKMLMPTLQNNGNAPGASLVPSQLKLISLR